MGAHGRPSDADLASRTAVDAPEVDAATAIAALAPGDVIGDFVLGKVLGRGAVGRVFRARQLSLERFVALKVSTDKGSEARAMAQLEHENVVQVFSDDFDELRGLRLLCMQYVPGATLAHVIRRLGTMDRSRWSGGAILEILDAESAGISELSAAALRERDELDGADFVEAVCFIGSRLAGALAYAHARGVLHRDVKPANILISQYGRVALADFGMSSRPLEGPRPTLGGTPAYMSPEHLEAFQLEIAPEEVGPRADLYSLGVVLYELVSGDNPLRACGAGAADPIAAHRAARARPLASLTTHDPRVPAALDRVVRRCLAHDEADRYASAEELQDALAGCGALARALRTAPRPGRITRAAIARPTLALVILAVLPHVVSSVINVAYNLVRIVSRLDPAQQAAFDRVTLVYNVVVYPLAIALSVRLLWPGRRMAVEMARGAVPSADALASVRRHVLTVPHKIAGIASLCWFPGGIAFPAAIHAIQGPVGADVFVHFAVSFFISGLIGLTYAFFAAAFVITRVDYPALWADGRGFRELPAAELATMRRSIRVFQVLAVLIPLCGAVVMIASAEAPASLGDRVFRSVLVALIVFGGGGVLFANALSGLLGRTLDALTAATPGRRLELER